MNVLITGGNGTVGGAITRRLIKRGWDVRVMGIEPEADIPGATYMQGDILDSVALAQAVQGCEAIIHLAAIANPMRVPAPDIFKVNVAGTYNVFEAAAQAGIKRIVQASSINAYGCFWGTVEIEPAYLPVDEAHPTYTTDVYSFSKQLVEDVGHYYWRREGISSIALRFPGVWTEARIQATDRDAHRQGAIAAIEELAALVPQAREARMAEIRAWSDDYRSRKQMEYPAASEGFASASYTDDPLWQVYTYQRFNFFAYIHEEDAAQSMEKGLTADYTGSHPLFVNAAQNSLGYDAQALAELFYPTARMGRDSGSNAQLADADALVSIEKARELIGFEPEY